MEATLIPSISIEALLAARDATIDALRKSREMLDQADERLDVFGCSAPELLMRVCADTDLAKVRSADHWDAIVYEVDRSIWQRLFVLTNIDTVMDHKTRNALFERLRGSRQGNRRPDDALPPLTRENIQATFDALRGQTGEFFEKCVEAVYHALSWDHKTNEPAKIGEKLIVTGAFYAWSRALQGDTVTLSGHESLHDLERVLCILDGAPSPTHTSPGLRQLRSIPWGTWVEVPHPTGGKPLMKIKCYRIGTTHVRITKREHVDAMNRIMAQRHPGALPEPPESKADRKRGEPVRPRPTSMAVAKTEQQRRQAFYTPDDVAERMAELAKLGPGWRTVLEPSAGEGALVRAALRKGAQKVTAIDNDPHAVRMLNLLRERCTRHDTEMTVEASDFFDLTPQARFGAVMMNPPFANAAEVEHVLQAWKWVAPGGRLVAVMSNAVTYRKDGRYKVFAEFLAQHGGLIEKLPSGTFEESGTMVETVLVWIDKPGVK